MPLAERKARKALLRDDRGVFRPGPRGVEEGDFPEGDGHVLDPEIAEIEGVLEKRTNGGS